MSALTGVWTHSQPRLDGSLPRRGASFDVGLARQSDRSFRFSTGLGSNFAVEASIDLIQWTRETEGEQQSLLQLRSPNPPPFPKRFFRLARPGGF